MNRASLRFSALTVLVAAGALPVPAQTPSQDHPRMIVESMRTVVDFANDGTGTRELGAEIRILKDTALKEFSVLVFSYPSDSTALEIVHVRVRKPDGSVVTTPAESIQDVAPAVALPSPVYTDAREKHVAVKGLAVGDTLEYQVRWRCFKAIVPGEFFMDFTLPETEVIKERSIQVSFPAARAVVVASPGRTAKETVEGGRKTLRWVQSNPVARVPPARAAWAGATAPDILVTSLRNWADLGAWYRGIAASQEVPDAAVRAKAKELTQGLSGDRERILALYTFVATRIHYIGISFGAGRYRPHAASEVLANGYGDCKDKHTLLAGLLKAVGLQAWPALMRQGGDIDRSIPSVTQFDHMVTVVPLGDSRLWLDTTPEVGPFGYLGPQLRGRPALVIPASGPAELVNAPQTLPVPQETRFTFQGRLEEGGRITGHCVLTARGDSELFYRQAYRAIPEQRWAEFLAQSSAPVGLGYTFTNIKPSACDRTEEPFTLEFDLSSQNASDWEGKRTLMPLMPAGLERTLAASPQPTDSIFMVRPGITYIVRGVLELPPSATPRIPASVSVASSAGTYRADYHLEGRVLSVDRRLTLRGGDVLPQDRKTFTDFLRAMNDDECRYLDLGGREIDLSRESPEVVARFNEGVEAQNRKDWTAARDAYRRVLEASPAFPGAHLNRGVTYLMKNDVAAATRDLLKEEELHPDLVMSYQLLGRVYDFQHRRGEAIAQWKIAFAKDPDERETATSLAQALRAEGRMEEVVAMEEKRLERDPGNVEDLLALAEAARGERAELAAAKAVAADGSPDTLVRAAGVLWKEGRNPGQARAWVEKGLAALAEAARKVQDTTEGLRNTRLARDAWITLGRLDLKDGRGEEGLRLLRTAWTTCFNGASGLALAEGLEQVGRRQQAVEQVDITVFSGRPVDPGVVNRLYKRLTGKSFDRGGRSPLSMKSLPSPSNAYQALRTTTFSCPRGGDGTVQGTLVLTPEGVEELRPQEDGSGLHAQLDGLRKVHPRVEIPRNGPQRLFLPAVVGFANGKGTLIILPD
jgi:tetratricopeptide (TPR) repeat protein